MTISTAMMMASAPSTPAAHSSARWPDENVRRAGGGRRRPSTAGIVVAPGFRPLGVPAILVGVAEGMAAGEARPAGRRLARPGRPAAGSHRGNGVGERTSAAVAHTRVFDQRYLDELREHWAAGRPATVAGVP